MPSRSRKVNWEAPPPPDGCVFIDVVAGDEGDSISIGNDASCFRVAGPKPRGGGVVINRFTARAEDLKKAIERYDTSPRPPRVLLDKQDVKYIVHQAMNDVFAGTSTGDWWSDEAQSMYDRAHDTIKRLLSQ